MHKFGSSRSLQQQHNNYFIRRSGSNNYSKSNEYNQNDQEEYEPVIINPMHNKNYNHNNLKLESTLTKDSSKNYENSLKSNNNNQNTQIQKQQQQPNNLSASQIYANLKTCGKCTRILIVDDQAFNSLSQARKLEKKFKLKSDRALSGQEAIQKIHEKLQSDCCKVYQLIIMDVNMPPGKDGFQTSQEIYNILYGLKVHQKTKICIHTAIYAEQTNQFIQSKKSLICKFLKKPPTDNAFQEVLYDCLVNREEQI
ncbi:CheY-like superfamily [Pseudocohnilembus persalinus]|uniref:CheY-like superfamily n=1 Tax=Pseudocohnilembus persalinus TaxID=266149 RepID=A0A0V0QS98_PSEPJ|nr:CheY-like superfamily [Pseudocohnilembus persalinus]|eukprot:KRX04856.1 CheY-like superfamily [Pseudocohnilembus persalinus]